MRWIVGCGVVATVAGCALVVGDLPEPKGEGAGGAAARDASVEAAVGGSSAGHAGAGGAGAGGAPSNEAGDAPTGGGSGGSTGGAAGTTAAGAAGDGSGATGGAAAAGGTGGTAGVAGSGTGGAAACGAVCDCDGDGVMAKGACGGLDCDDDDRDVRPNQTTYFPVAAASLAVGFDYDCSGAPDRDPALDRAVNCSGVSLLDCNTTLQGYFGGPPTCGTAGAWGTCKKGALLCEQDPIDQRVMRCR